MQNPPNCLYCHKALPKQPRRSITCPLCKNVNYMKSTPNDRAKRLMTWAQKDSAETEWQQHHDEQQSIRGENIPSRAEIIMRHLVSLEEHPDTAGVEIESPDHACAFCRSQNGKMYSINFSKKHLPIMHDSDSRCSCYKHCLCYFSVVFWDETTLKQRLSLITNPIIYLFQKKA